MPLGKDEEGDTVLISATIMEINKEFTKVKIHVGGEKKEAIITIYNKDLTIMSL